MPILDLNGVLILHRGRGPQIKGEALLVNYFTPFVVAWPEIHNYSMFNSVTSNNFSKLLKASKLHPNFEMWIFHIYFFSNLCILRPDEAN